MRYRLATYRECKAHREWNTTCPDCGRRGKFSPYIDTVTMRPVDDRRCGRCNRLSNCGYHLPPREMENGFIKKEERYTNSPSVYRGSTAQPGGSSKRSAEQDDTTRYACNAPALTGIPSMNRGGVSGDAERIHYSRMRRACEQSQPWGSHLVTWLRTRFPREQVAATLKRYRVGGTPDGATLWWQIDEQGRVHTGKAMQYNPLTGHRVKERTPSVPRTSPPLWGESSAMAAGSLSLGEGGGRDPFPVNWAHRMRLYGEPSDLVVPQCLFGLHLASPLPLPRRGDSDIAIQDSPPWEGVGEVAIVESEKTALIMSLIKPDTVWLATGGKANFKESMLWPLLGHEVAVYPDADALRDWAVRIAQLNRKLGHRLYIPTGYYNLMDHDEARREGWDLADVIEWEVEG